MLKAYCTTLALFCIAVTRAAGQDASAGNQIIGTWNAREKTFTMEVYRQGQEYRAKIVSFTSHRSAVPPGERTDEHNPDPGKRSRKLLGMDVLSGLHYNSGTGTWTNGRIYNVESGSSYSATASLNKGVLSVRAFKGISTFGKTLHFRRQTPG